MRSLLSIYIHGVKWFDIPHIITGVLRVLITYRVKRPAFLPIACGAMFRLNRYARAQTRGTHKGSIYDLKNRFVRMLYESGYCTDVALQEQVLECWACNDKGEIYDPQHGEMTPCWKCGGSNIYRRFILYRFHFNVRGTRWIWHQPQDLVTWPVELDGQDDVGQYQQPTNNGTSTPTNLDRDIILVWAALRSTHCPVRLSHPVQLNLPGFSKGGKSYRCIPFPWNWYGRSRWVKLVGMVKLWWYLDGQKARVKSAILRRLWPWYDEIPF